MSLLTILFVLALPSSTSQSAFIDAGDSFEKAVRLGDDVYGALGQAVGLGVNVLGEATFHVLATAKGLNTDEKRTASQVYRGKMLDNMGTLAKSGSEIGSHVPLVPSLGRLAGGVVGLGVGMIASLGEGLAYDCKNYRN